MVIHKQQCAKLAGVMQTLNVKHVQVVVVMNVLAVTQDLYWIMDNVLKMETVMVKVIIIVRIIKFYLTDNV